MTDTATLPDGQESFKLNEVCKLANVQPYMLRFWATEFAQLEAVKSGTGQRLYSREQVELILEVRRLLFDEGLTIAGARKRISSPASVHQRQPRIPRPAEPEYGPVEEAEIEADVEPELEASEEIAEEAVAPETAGEPEVEAEPVAEEAAAVPTEAEVDKIASERVQPLLASLRQVRDEISQIVKRLEPTAKS